jgi:hypothetical protein
MKMEELALLIETKFFPGKPIYGEITPRGVICLFNDEKITCGNLKGIVEISKEHIKIIEKQP